jgi:uncharacterized protein (DUF924 family)
MDNNEEVLLHFWFGTDGDDAVTAREKAELWWGHSFETDELLGDQFGRIAAEAARGQLGFWRDTPRGRLALILLLDQLPRAIHRGTPLAFAQDATARQLAESGLAVGTDRLLRPIERLFFYLPFEHSEDLADQNRSVQLFRELGASVPGSHRETFDGFLQYAIRHHEVIERFGRFPHRNRILGRESTPEELAFLDEPGSSF